MSAADCERWENHLLDLAYGEVDPRDEAEVRGHLDGCDHCRAGLARLARGRSLARELPQEEPPAEVISAVLGAARDRARELAAARHAERPDESSPAPPAPPPEPVAGPWRWLVALATSPQLAMVSLLVLTVGVGLWWFPAVSGVPTAAPPLLAEPHGADVRPEALAPAEPLRFDVDPRTGRVEALGDSGRGERPDRATEPARRTAAPEPLPSAEASPEETATAAPLLGPPGAEDDVLAPPAAEAVGAPPEDEVAPPEVDGALLLSSALLTQARDLARGGHEREAAARYEAWIERHPNGAEAPQAMLELAGIYRRLGRLDRARSWLDRAAEHRAPEGEVRRERLRLDLMRVAPGHADEPGEAFE
jgi:hypothetical protein